MVYAAFIKTENEGFDITSSVGVWRSIEVVEMVYFYDQFQRHSTEKRSFKTTRANYY